MPERRGRQGLWVLLAAVLTLALAVTISACGGDDDEDGDGAAEEAPAEIKDITMLLAFPKESAAWLPVHVAENQGYFEEEGVNIDTPAVDGSGFVVQQLIAQNQDWGWAGAPSVVIGATEDEDLRSVACNQAKNIFTIEAVEGSGVEEVTDLNGKRLGITQRGGGEEPLIESIIAENDLDVEVVPLGESGPAAIRAIENGEVDAFSGGITDIFTLKAGGAQLTDITPQQYQAMPGDCFTTTSQVLQNEENQELAASVIRAWVKGSFFSEANPEAAVDIVCEAVPEQCQDREGFTTPFVEQMIGLLQPLDPDLPPNALDTEGWQTTAEVLERSGAIDQVPDINALVDSPEVQAVTDMAYENVDQLREEAEEDADNYQPSG